MVALRISVVCVYVCIICTMYVVLGTALTAPGTIPFSPSSYYSPLHDSLINDVQVKQGKEGSPFHVVVLLCMSCFYQKDEFLDVFF